MPSIEPGLVRCSASTEPVCVLRAAMLLEELAVDGVTLASPKSRILACPRLVTKMLAGLMSRWTMPSAWAASSASAISMASDRISSGFHRPPGNAVLQRQPVQKLHGNEGFAVLVVNFVDGADVGMIQRGGGLGLALKAAEGLRVFGDVVGQELKSDKAAELHVLGLVDHTHPAAAELLDDAVVRDGLADHWSTMLRL